MAIFMCCRRSLWFIFAFALTGRLVAAAPATTAPSFGRSAEVDTLIAQLSDPRWQIRNRAVEQLVQWGSTAEPQLSSLRDRVATVDLRARIELTLNRIRESRHSGSTYVTLHLNAVTTRDAIDALSRESGAKFDAGAADVAGSGGPITVNADHMPFWIVLRDLCAQAKLEVATIDVSGLITLRSGTDADWGTRQASITGPYLLLAKRMELAREVDLSRPKDVTNAYTLVLLSYAEPKLKPMYWAVRSIDECVTETGQHLQSSDTENLDTGDLNSESETRFQFNGPADASRRIAKLRLSARFVLSEKSQPIEIGNVLKVKNESRTIGGWRVIIKGVTKTDDERYSAALSVFRDGRDPDDWSERMGLLSRVAPRLLDKAGKTIESSGASHNEGPDEWDWTDEFTPANPDGRPLKLVWDFPLETRHADVLFEFKDLPLP
jgi:hypothetical protein